MPAVWIVRANSICFGGEVAVRVVGEQLGQDQQAVQRRAQLVAHVRQELGLVLRATSASCSAFSSRPSAGHLDLAVLDLDVAVLLGEQRRLLLELGVGVLQLDRLALQLLGEALRLLEQLLGAGVGDDRVEHDADGLDRAGRGTAGAAR